jgi:sporulation protein YlmC with PRC-barrel domain
MSVRRRRVLYLHDLLGRRVVDAKGEPVGRIEEVRAERRGDDLEIAEYLLGPGALRQRLAMTFRRGPRPIAVRWDQMDISDPEHPRLTCDVREVRGARRGGRQ